MRLLDPASPTRSPLVVDERVLHHLVGAGELEPELAAVARPAEPCLRAAAASLRARPHRRCAAGWRDGGSSR